MAVKPKQEKAEEADETGNDGPDGRRRKLKLFLLLAGVLFLGAGMAGGAFYYFGLSRQSEDTSGRQVAVVSLGAPEIIDFPELMVDLRTDTCRAPYLRFRMAIEASGASRGLVTNLQPHIIDATQQYLRNQSRQDLVGVEGADRMRNDVREVINRLIAPERINSVIFKKFLLQ
ncbi:MAG: hypothetical protein FJX42_06230 [Alphaproteobacteria bacterium]|nr:hypothetical protein [Alphaproteobacteria bacterium]